MSTIKTTTLSTLDGTATVPVNTVVNGSAKAWVNFNGTGTVAIRASFNVTSITDNGTGNYTINFTSALADANYAVSTGGCYLDNNTVERNFGVTTESFATSSVKILSADMTTGSALDVAIVSASIFR
jgi:hypothetical protein